MKDVRDSRRIASGKVKRESVLQMATLPTKFVTRKILSCRDRLTHAEEKKLWP